MTPPTVGCAGVGKRYKKLSDRFAGASMGTLRRTQSEDFWAVRDVDLAVSAGECIGLVGRNGSGKSTLLSMIAGVSAPTEGTVSIRGKVAPLLSVGVGFHPELTGRENVYVNGTVLGMRRQEIDRRFDEMVAFAEIERFLDTPVKFYSSGMFVRLGFAVAINSTPDVLLVDEVLAVGDLAFQVKCFDRMREMQEQGTTVVVVTHNLQAMEVLCTRAVVLDGGRMQYDGPVHAAVGHYHRLLTDDSRAAAADAASSSRVLAIELCAPDGEPAESMTSGSEVVCRMELARDPADRDPLLQLTIADDRSDIYTDVRSWSELGLGESTTAVVQASLRLPLTTGTYSARATLASEGAAVSDDDTVPPTFFRITLDRPVNGVVDLAASCDVVRSG